jgi:hypothetical protein
LSFDFLQVYKAWIDPEALTVYGGIVDCSQDAADSVFVEGNR